MAEGSLEEMQHVEDGYISDSACFLLEIIASLLLAYAQLISAFTSRQKFLKSIESGVGVGMPLQTDKVFSKPSKKCETNVLCHKLPKFIPALG